MILVTGATGLVGSHLLYQLVSKGEKVRAIIRDKNKIENVRKVFSYYSQVPDQLIEKVDWYSGDVLDILALEKAFEGIHTVYHCAAIISFNNGSKKQLIQTNIQGTENVVTLCVENKIAKLCYVSSVAAVGSSENGEPITEDDMWIPSNDHSLYSISKFKSEMEVWRGIEEGLNAVIVNPSVILGPGFWNTGSGEIISRAAKGMLFYTEGITGFVDVRDVADAMIKLTESDIQGQRFILNSENCSYKDLFFMISDESGKKRPKFNTGKNLLALAWIADSLLSFFTFRKQKITKSIIKSSLNKSKYSNRKIKTTIEKEFIPIKETIRFTLEKFNEEIKH
ncbi:MAG: hypothetical protein A2X13_07815 [Bacteroidetes bacterium GWC2_33_15]|nr:MAG: hypothetical protein A2X10_04870 [Bacteroidetes bacterium GWA2_33_15]OFX52658.1 MAG: hypothetical protein A2X13_07815 [Bacteroidetes bacterium GWC2_33_15]OFX64036.1 MAG: hypothetical protein A2X15_02520 [Bacteroidetes bacterium GWB2_32_14]OFX67279.1 MAG: hypothetical protein A2X14_11895 [Bacteroidetes bacterium GWD2_33_33]HAN18862.1 NAD-dependent epimerase [Bacteroidales bacterium]